MKKQFTIVVKGNQFADQYTNKVATPFTKWSFKLDYECHGVFDLKNIEFKGGLTEREITEKLKQRTREYLDIVKPCDMYPEYLDIEALRP